VTFQTSPTPPRTAMTGTHRLDVKRLHARLLRQRRAVGETVVKRDAAMRALRDEGWTLQAIGDLVGMDRQAVAECIARAERKRTT
jgi:hypothetical protein